MDIQGGCCGNFDGEEVPEGYWLRPDGAPDSVSRLEFFDRVGQARFTAIWLAMQAHPELAFTVMRGFAAETVHVGTSFPAILSLEAMGVIPAGSAIEVWS